jgi:hypothetical protein
MCSLGIQTSCVRRCAYPSSPSSSTTRGPPPPPTRRGSAASLESKDPHADAFILSHPARADEILRLLSVPPAPPAAEEIRMHVLVDLGPMPDKWAPQEEVGPSSTSDRGDGASASTCPTSKARGLSSAVPTRVARRSLPPYRPRCWTDHDCTCIKKDLRSLRLVELGPRMGRGAGLWSHTRWLRPCSTWLRTICRLSTRIGSGYRGHAASLSRAEIHDKVTGQLLAMAFVRRAKICDRLHGVRGGGMFSKREHLVATEVPMDLTLSACCGGSIFVVHVGCSHQGPGSASLRSIRVAG